MMGSRCCNENLTEEQYDDHQQAHAREEASEAHEESTTELGRIADALEEIASLLKKR